ncbi:pimeloyl-ACP methyl ester carboxylesterase [Rhizobium sp. SG_E_25_P2]|uniref:alpha/beta fold hydrolase n=1 Tax=Rhizobium sp. SG_E_25_P2 TaxID=2879942 RepID=UPI002475E14C|nr:alpha/beta hydrolase [Rhizobium sp. SG_E_25_P2]MDH6269492.1 pimeloyl-ACP methyl ester carboxylesterase [Rhizobium sp. SG_E_25_P2]
MIVLAKFIAAIVLSVAALTALAFVFSRWEAARIAARYPNIGELTDVGGFRMNSLHWPQPAVADLPPLVFIHGASGNLRDPWGAFFEPLKDRAEMLFVDRPGHGYSERGGAENLTPAGQSDAIATLMRKKGITRAIIIGHSFGGATAASFALRHPEMTEGLLFLAPATHPWPGGVDWYYDLANLPAIGPAFCHTLALPAGLLQLRKGITHVFSPNAAPAAYIDRAAIPLVLRPANFCDNARDVANLLAYVTKIQPRYKKITAPAIVITGDSDDIVLEEIHSRGLKRDLPHSELLWVRHLGHKPDYIATDLAIAAIEKIAGKPRDLESIVREVEARIAPRT